MAKAQSKALKPYPSVFLNIYCCQVANAKQQEGLWDLLLYWAVLEHAQEFVQLLGVKKGKAEEGKRGEWEKVKETVLNPSSVDSSLHQVLILLG